MNAKRTKISAFKLDVPNLPNNCGYGGDGSVTMAKPAAIKRGRFTAKLTERIGPSTVAATARLTGHFVANHRETGTITTTVPANTSCNGRFPYTTKAH